MKNVSNTFITLAQIDKNNFKSGILLLWLETMAALGGGEQDNRLGPRAYRGLALTAASRNNPSKFKKI